MMRNGTGFLHTKIDGLGSRASTKTDGATGDRAVGWRANIPRFLLLFEIEPAWKA
jgi:hypothetical protein